MHQFLISLKGMVDPPILVMMVLISIFEILIDRPALKRQGFTRDAKITVFLSIVLIVSAAALGMVKRLVK